MINRKVHFKNKLFYYLLICFIGILIIYNIYIIVNNGSFYGLITVGILIILIVLLLIKHRFVKIVIVVWAVIAFVIGNGFELVADLLDDINNNFQTVKLDSYLINIIGFSIGITIITCAMNFIEIITRSDVD
jgi:hypothetical protein